MSEQLDWLARNVHEWPEGKNFAQVSRDVYFYAIKPVSGESYSKQQWLDRRAELQGKPSWETAPKWATHLAQQVTGDWMWCDGEDGGWFGCFDRSTCGEVLGDWRDTLERRPASLGVSARKAAAGFAAIGDALRPLSRADALRWVVENIKTWPTVWQPAILDHENAPAGWQWTQMCGSMWLAAKDNVPAIGEAHWWKCCEKVACGEGRIAEEFVAKPQSGFEPLTSMEDPKPVTLHTIHHAAFLHHGCQLLLNEPELVVFRTADGELLHCKPKECLIDPNTYGLAARLLSDMSGCNVAPEHIRELAGQMGWAV